MRKFAEWVVKHRIVVLATAMILLVPACSNNEEDAPKKGKTRNRTRGEKDEKSVTRCLG